MAAAEFVSDASSEIQLTATPLTSDQSAASYAASPETHNPTRDDHAYEAVVKREQPPTSAQDTQPQLEIHKDCDVILDASSAPQACQQIEIASEEPASFEPSLPQIDAVWSIGLEHSYEHRPEKCKERAGSPDKADEAFQLAEHKETNSNNSSECDKENCTHSIEIHHTLRLSHSDNQVQESVPTATVQAPQILKIQTKASKKYFIQDGADPSGKRPRYLTLHDTKTQATVRKAHKATQALKLPSSHGIPQPSLSSCLIDHNLKPLQIQHNLENKKSQSKAVLRLETLGLKYEDDITETIQYPIKADPSPCLLKKPSRRGNGDRFILKEIPAGYLHADDEVGSDAVYHSTDASPSTCLDFNNTSQLVEMEDAGAEENVNSMLDNSLQSLSMDQYLPDFSDLPQFPNIPLDAEDDMCPEPQYLTPSIPHSVLSYDWQQNYASCCGYTSHATPSIITQPQIAVATIPNPTSLSKFVEGRVNSPCKVRADVDAVVSVSVGGVVPAQLSVSGENTHTLTQLNSAMMMTSASSTATTTMMATLKTENQVRKQDFSLPPPPPPPPPTHTHISNLCPNFCILYPVMLSNTNST